MNIAVLTSTHKKLQKELKVVLKVAARVTDYQFHIVTDKNSNSNMETSLISANMKLYAGKKYEILKQSNAAMVFSGVGSLEAALMNCPHVLIRNNSLKDKLNRKKLTSHVNKVVNREVVKELHKPDDILKELNLILSNQNYCAGIMADYQELKNLIGMERASYKAAVSITEWLEESGSS